MKKFHVDSNGHAIPKKQGRNIAGFIRTDREQNKNVQFFTDVELACLPTGSTFVFDTESYVNYWLVAFKHVDSGKLVYLENTPDGLLNIERLMFMLFHFRLISFNGNNYDIPMCLLAARGWNAEQLNNASRFLVSGARLYEVEREYAIYYPPGINHIDLIEVCPLSASLKIYAGRLHTKKMQDLPYDFRKELTFDEAGNVRFYCFGDLDSTELIFKELAEQINLRYELSNQYGIDLRSKSDAQIAEAVITSEVKKVTGFSKKKGYVDTGYIFQYEPPPYLKFQTPGMQQLLKTVAGYNFEIDDSGKVVLDDLSEYPVLIGDTLYQMGKGGLHSKEKSVAYKAKDGYMICDIDVESFYPRLILNSGLYPKSLGPAFLEVFESIVNRRVKAKGDAKAAKEAKDDTAAKLFKVAADSLKITINGTFGKLGSIYSAMYAPNLLIQVTVTGQLLLLMLIEMLELVGIKAISANTDGVVCYFHESQYELFKAKVKEFEQATSLKMEETKYAALYSRDINNYIAVKTDGKVKGKGAFSNPWIDPELAIFRFHKNPQTTVCIEAAYAAITKQTNVEKFIKECNEFAKFVSVKNAKAPGAEKDGYYLGKAIRWYYAKNEKGCIRYVESGNKIGKSDGAKPVMDLPSEFPTDIDYQWYVNETYEILRQVAYVKRLALF